jgi:spermidine synthase
LASLAAPGQDPGRLVGGAYAANTLGAIFGSLAGGLVFVPLLGTQHTQQALIGLTLVSALLAFGSLIDVSNRAAVGRWAGIAAACVVVAFGLVRTVPSLPWPLVAYGRQLMLYSTEGTESLYLGEGLNATVGVTEWQDVRSFHVAGKTEASTLPKDMRLQRMLGHIPALFHPAPKSVLIVGCGAGVTAGSFLNYPGIERIVICEIEPLIPARIAPYFAEQNYDVVNDPRVEIVYDDARHYILTTREKFDIITSDPIHPWVKGAATLYTTEYFDLVKQRLNPGGVVTQWVPFYESDAAVVKSEIATFFEAFPGGSIWGNDESGFGYDVVMLGGAEPMVLDVDAIEARLVRDDFAPVRESLDEVGLGTVLDLFGTYAGRDVDLGDLLDGAEINRDRNLRLQYLAGLQLNSDEGRALYGPLLTYRQFPSDLFQGTTQTLDAVRAATGLWNP